MKNVIDLVLVTLQYCNTAILREYAKERSQQLSKMERVSARHIQINSLKVPNYIESFLRKLSLQDSKIMKTHEKTIFLDHIQSSVDACVMRI